MQPKDKKSKEEKSLVLGIASIDLLPLLQGQLSLKESVKLRPLDLTTSETETELLEVDLDVSVKKPLLSNDDVNNSNILFLRVKGMYSLPDEFSTGHSYTVATRAPRNTNEDPSVLSIKSGELKAPGDVDIGQANGQWKWTGINPSSVGLACLVPNSVLNVNAVEDENGELRSQKDIDFRRSAECNKPHVTWNSEIRSYINPKVAPSFLVRLSKASHWPVEVVRVTTTPGRGKEDEISISHHGVAYIDHSALLYPGNTKVHGAYMLHPMIESELADITKNRHERSIMDNAHQSSVPVGGSKKALGGGKRPGTGMRTSVVSMTSQTEVPGTQLTEDKHEGQVYLDNKTYILLEIELAKPLIPKRPVSVIAKRISEYIPPRPALPRRIGGAEKAINDYHTVTADVASLLLTDYRDLFSDLVSKDALPNTPEASEERRSQLVYHLNKTGHYHAYKEHLKRSVISLVRQKFLNEASTTNQEELQAFLSKLYTYLVDEMHTGLGKVFFLEESVPAPPTIVDCDMLRQYALEAELMLDLEMAEHYHKELLSREDHISLHWYEYGVFSLLKGDKDCAEECFKQSVALDQQFVPALLLYGVCCSLDERFAEADEMMELATTIDTRNIIAWTVRGLCYELSSNSLYRDMCLDEADKLTTEGKKKTYIIPGKIQGKRKSDFGQNEVKSQIITEGKSQVLSEEHSELQSEKHDTSLDRNDSTSNPLLTDQQEPTELHVEKDQVTPEDLNVSGTIEPHPEKEGEELEDQPPSAFLQTASYLLDVHVAKYAEMCLAHQHIIEASKKHVTKNKKQETGTKEEIEKTNDIDFFSVPYHIALARLHLLNGDYERAESHLTRAVQEDVLNSNAVSLLGHCLYLSGKFSSARDYYERVIEYVNPPAHIGTVLLRLADIYMRANEFSKSKSIYLRACRNSPSSVTWRGVGIACYMLQEYNEAEDALSEANILNNLDPIVWAYLSLVCHKTDRHQEASQAINFAIKTGLKDQQLLNQLQNITC